MSGDLERLQGQWRQIRFEENGRVDPPDSHGAAGAVMTISGQSFHVVVPGGKTLIEGCFALDDAANPKGIDWIDSMGEDAGKTLPAIYELADDRFQFWHQGISPPICSILVPSTRRSLSTRPLKMRGLHPVQFC